MLIPLTLALVTLAHAPATGAYRVGKQTVYVGVDGEPPDRPSLEYYDPATRKLGSIPPGVVLSKPVMPVLEKPYTIVDGGGRLGASLWYAPGATRRATILLIEGADNSDRRMGFIIPYFVAHGLNVITYDQRGTGESAGNWRYASPEAKADDTIALLKRASRFPQVDSRRMGLWAASSGGWVAPIVATRYPVAFMILKSAPAQTIADNVRFEIRNVLLARTFSDAQIADAMAFNRTIMTALETNTGWAAAADALARAKTKPWFPYMRIPPGLTLPLAPPMLAAFRAALIYDPSAVLRKVRTPTLAIFGSLDREENASGSARIFLTDFTQAGIRDLTIDTIPGADHYLFMPAESPAATARYAGDYPGVMIRWLAARGFTN